MSIERIVAIVCALVCAVGGYLIGAYRGELKIKDIQLQAAVLRAEQGGAAYKKLVAAQDALADDTADLRADAERVRRAAEDRVRRAEAASGGTDSSAESGCARLLGRCAELLARGGELAQSAAARHDAVTAARR